VRTAPAVKGLTTKLSFQWHYALTETVVRARAQSFETQISYIGPKRLAKIKVEILHYCMRNWRHPANGFRVVFREHAAVFPYVTVPFPCEVKIAFVICSERNNVGVLCGTLKVQSFFLTEVSDCGLLIVVTSSTFLKRKDMLKEKSS